MDFQFFLGFDLGLIALPLLGIHMLDATKRNNIQSKTNATEGNNIQAKTNVLCYQPFSA